jgi:hypothetical protein
MHVISSFQAVRSGAPHPLRAYSDGAGMLRACTSLNFLSCKTFPSVDAVALIGQLRSRRGKFPARVAKLCVPLSEAGYNFVRIESLNASGVPACRGSGVPCAIDLAGEAITDTKTGSRHHRLSGFSRRCIHSSSIAFTGRFLPSALNGILMICTDTVSSYFAIVQKRPRLKPICKELVAALAQEAAVCARRTQVAATLRRNTPAFATAAMLSYGKHLKAEGRALGFADLAG